MGWKEVLQIIIFALAWFPVGILVSTSFSGGSEIYEHDFSIYNDEYDGLSQYRLAIEEANYDVVAIQSTMSVISRYNGSAILVIMGPVQDFTIDAVLTIFQHLDAGGSILIADDFGTANRSFQILNNILRENLAGSLPVDIDGFLSFTGGVLLDLDSYDRSPKLPVIRDLRVGLDGGAITAGVSELNLNWATCLSPRSLIGAAGIAYTTIRAWCENDIEDTNPAPDEDEWAGALPVAGALDLALAGMQGRIVAVSDPSMFNNDMWSRSPGNRRFGLNIINWLSQNDPSIPVVFCENLLAIPVNSPEWFFGNYLGRILWMTSNPILAPIYPLMTAIGIRKYLPDMKKIEVTSVSEVFLRRGQTYFSERMAYYRTEGNYARVVKLLYRKLRRDMRRKQQMTEFSPEKVWELMKHKDTKLEKEKFLKTFDRIEEISSNPGKRLRESEMMDLFFFIRNITSQLVDTKR
ncbi:MAG: hypothetical protein BAJATHORv1_20073 [Candidatus Thorarchaeota archaeon]|nr:MAG: hypothetical protein BAJATHORv1_20073 [Candidatus Thorarchaeota archaeon]